MQFSLWDALFMVSSSWILMLWLWIQSHLQVNRSYLTFLPHMPFLPLFQVHGLLFIVWCYVCVCVCVCVIHIYVYNAYNLFSLYCVTCLFSGLTIWITNKHALLPLKGYFCYCQDSLLPVVLLCSIETLWPFPFVHTKDHFGMSIVVFIWLVFRSYLGSHVSETL